MSLRRVTPGGCWDWLGSVGSNGYGYMQHAGETWRMHRLVWTLLNGPIPDGMIVMHSCDNRLCINPEHLVMGTQQQNIKDAYAKGRMGPQKLSVEFLEQPSEPVKADEITMNTLFDKYEAECIPELEWRSQRDYRSILVYLRKTFGHMAPREVKPKHIVAFLDVRKGKIHRNRMVTILSTVYFKAIGKWCVDEELTNPCSNVERWPTKPRKRYVTDDEFNRFRAATRAQVQIAMDLALLTGQRQGDIIGMKWSQVKTGEGLARDRWHIEIDQGKTGKKLAIAISEAVEKVLDRAWLLEPHWPREYVLRTKWGNAYTEDGFRAMWQRYCREWEKAGNPRFHFHDLRAKCISDNQNFDAAYMLSGHIDPKMTRGVYDRARRLVQPLR